MIELTIDEPKAKSDLAKRLASTIKNAVVVCIGTEKVVADSLGPRVGSLLNENLATSLFVYGLQGANITAENLPKAIHTIKRLHPNAPLLVIDAAVGSADQIGKVQLSNSAITPGAATNKHLQSVGDISIVGIVADKNMSDFYENSCERAILVERLSQFVATAIIMATKCKNV